MLQQVERRAFALEQKPGAALTLREHVTRLNRIAVLHIYAAGEAVVEQGEYPHGDFHAAHDPLRLCEKAGGGSAVRRDHQVGGGVEIVDVFLECGGDNVIHRKTRQQHAVVLLYA